MTAGTGNGRVATARGRTDGRSASAAGTPVLFEGGDRSHATSKKAELGESRRQRVPWGYHATDQHSLAGCYATPPSRLDPTLSVPLQQLRGRVVWGVELVWQVRGTRRGGLSELYCSTSTGHSTAQVSGGLITVKPQLSESDPPRLPVRALHEAQQNPQCIHCPASMQTRHRLKEEDHAGTAPRSPAVAHRWRPRRPPRCYNSFMLSPTSS